MRAAGIALGLWLGLSGCAGAPAGGDGVPTAALPQDALPIETREDDAPAIDGYQAFKRGFKNRAAAAPAASLGELPEELLLDVGIAAFQMPVGGGESVGGELAEVRRAEGKYLPSVLKNVLRHTGRWGAVRVVPRASAAIDVAVVVAVERADGDALALRARVMDVRGATWFDRRYRASADDAAFGQPDRAGKAPFQAAYAALASDMADHLSKLHPDELARIRTVGALRFADSLVPGAFARYMAEDEHGQAEPVRLPAADDPLFASARRIRSREHLFIDTADEYFEQFSAHVHAPYLGWQREAHGSAVTARELRRQAQSERLLGATSIVAGLALADAEADASHAALASVANGVVMLRAASRKDEEMLREADELRDEGERAGAEMLPHTVALEHRMEALERDVETHYADLRRILRRVYDERGLAPLQAPPTVPPRHFAPLAPPAPPNTGENGPAKAAPETPLPELPPLSNAVQEGLAAAAAQIRRKQLAAAFDTLNGLLRNADRLKGRELGEIYSLLAIAHFDDGDVDASAAAFETVALHADKLPHERVVATYYNLTGVHVRAKNYPAAAKYMHRAVAESRMLSTACATVCGTAQPGVGRPERSRSGRVRLRILRRVAQARQLGRIDAAAATADLRVLIYNSEHGHRRHSLNQTELALLHDDLAALYLRQGEFDRARESLEQVAARIAVIPQGKGTAALYHLAQLHFEAGNYEQSMQYQRRWLARSDLVEQACPKVCGEPER